MKKLQLFPGPTGRDYFGELFSQEIGAIVYDAQTIYGKWALMTPVSFAKHGVKDALETGRAQQYRRQADGTWLLVD